MLRKNKVDHFFPILARGCFPKFLDKAQILLSGCTVCHVLAQFFCYHVSYDWNVIATYSAKNMNEGMYFSNSLPADITQV